MWSLDNSEYNEGSIVYTMTSAQVNLKPSRPICRIYFSLRNIYDRWLLTISSTPLQSFILPHCKNSWLPNSPIVCIIQLLMFRCVKIHVLNYLDRFGWVWLKSDLPFLDQEIEILHTRDSLRNHEKIMTKSWQNRISYLTRTKIENINFWLVFLKEK